ncbi:MAG TPA: hypothetical protein VFY22_01350, partial [Hydrogenophaga sp.]|nr:hypothetical protein [Hydrogenophaga sp.]
ICGLGVGLSARLRTVYVRNYAAKRLYPPPNRPGIGVYVVGSCKLFMTPSHRLLAGPLCEANADSVPVHQDR